MTTKTTAHRPPPPSVDDDALPALIDRLLRYARSKVRNEAMAEDAVAETLLAALEARRELAAPTSAWLFGVLKHKLVDQLRKMQREQPAGDMALECDRDLPSWSGGWNDSHSRTHDPEQRVQRQQLMTLIAGACATLPLAQARAFQMREVMDMDTETICASLGVQRGHLWVLTHRARRHLRLVLTQHRAGPPE